MKKYNFFIKQVKYDFLIFFREPFFAFPILILPAIFFVIFTSSFIQTGQINNVSSYIPTYALLISYLTIFFNIGLQSVADRELGIYKRIIVSPVNIFFIVGTYIFRGTIISLVGLFEILYIGKFIYKTPINGNVLLLIVTFLILSSILLLVSLTFHGFFKNSRQVFPFTIFSFQYVLFATGLIIPIGNLPVLFQWLVYINPIYYMNEVLLAVWKNNSIGVVNVTALLITVVVCVYLLLVQRKMER